MQYHVKILDTPTNLRVQRQSEGFKYGNGTTHTQAVLNVIEFFLINRKKKEWYAIEEYLVRSNNDKWNKKEHRIFYQHSYDIAILDNQLKSILFIEVDGPKHDTQRQKLNDQRAERYASEILDVPVIRLKKVECLGIKADVRKHLSKELAKYLK